MTLTTIIFLGIGLAMDAFAVSICKGLALRKTTAAEMGKAALWFGIFQGLMPAIGYVFGSLFAGYIESFSSWIGFLLLALIGGNMIREGINTDEEHVDAGMGAGQMLLLAVATSIDALAVGLTFSVVPVSIISHISRFWNTMLACVIICVETGIISAAGIRIGGIFGAKFKNKAEIAGGMILVLIGLRIILSHYGIL